MAEPPAAITAITAIPGLPPEASARLLAVLGAEPAVQEVWLYGSRAMGRHRPGSDIDLTLVGPNLRHDDRLRLIAALDDLLLPWSIGLSLSTSCPNPCISMWLGWAGGLPPKERRRCDTGWQTLTRWKDCLTVYPPCLDRF
jgi:predicted nucleotidyltransferase